MYKLKNNRGTEFTIKYGDIVDKYIINTHVSNGQNNINTITLIDTGANCSCISKDLVNKINLQPIDIVTINTPSNKAIVNVYALDIVINNEAIIGDARVCDSNIGNQGLDLLLGTDIIGMGDMNITNNKETVLSFRIPSKIV